MFNMQNFKFYLKTKKNKTEKLSISKLLRKNPINI